MIDLTRTEQQMLAEIGAQSTPGPGVAPGASVPPAPEEARLVVRGRTPDELLPTLMEAFSRRYAFLPKERVFADLSHLVKKGLGNAYKWGNEGDADRVLVVRAVMTGAGAVVAIADEGRGFDVPEVLGRFRRDGAYFRHGGSGFSHFQETRSIISYADGGRLLLIRFLCATEAEPHASGENGAMPSRRAPRRHIDVRQLEAGSQVKVKGSLRSDGRFYAAKVSVKAAEACAVIDGRIRHVDEVERRIGLLNAVVRLPEGVDIASPEQRRIDVGALRVGQAVELTGRYSSEEGFLPIKVQVRPDSSQPFEEIQGAIDDVSSADGTLRVLGMTVTTDAETEVKDKRPD